MVDVVAKTLANLALDLVRVFDDAVDRVVESQPLRCGLWADFRHARDIVGTVTHECEVIDHLFRRHAEFGDDPVPIEDRVAHRVDQGDAGRHELRDVLVARRYHHLHPAVAGTAAKRADDVIGLNAFDSEERQAHAGDGIENRLNLLAKVIRHWRPVGLVLRVQVIPKRFARRIEDDRKVLGVLFPQQLVQHVEHAVDRARRRSVSRR